MPRLSLPHGAPRLAWIGLGATFIAATLYLTGTAPALLLLTSAALAVSAARAHVAWVYAVGTGLTAWSLVVLAGASLAYTTTLPYTWVMCSLFVALSLGSVAVLWRSRPTHRRARERSRSGWWALTGPALWALAAAVSALRPTGFKVGWVIMGDSANNLNFAREIITDNGTNMFVGTSNPVPLVHTILAASMAPGRDGLAPGPLVARDFLALAGTWHAFIALTCLLAGAAAWSVARLIPRTPSWAEAAIAAGASTFPLTWFMTGYPIEFGFVNAHLTDVILLSAVLAVLGARTQPIISWLTLCGLTILTLATWAPLVPLVGIAAAALLLQPRALFESRRAITATVAGAASVLLYSVTITLPHLRAQADSLGAAGGFVTYPRYMLPMLTVIVVAGSLLFVPRRETVARWGLGAIAAVSPAALVAVLALAGKGLTMWGYYPHKLAWLASCLLVIVAMGLLAGVFPLMQRWPSLRAPAAAAAAAAIALGVTTDAANRFTPRGDIKLSPMARLVAGNFDTLTESVPDAVEALTSEGHIEILWATDVPDEYTTNFWILLRQSAELPEETAPASVTDFRSIAYFQDNEDASQLCVLSEIAQEPVIAWTDDPTLADRVEQECDAQANVTVRDLADRETALP